jgi:hypothetical protein
VQSRTLLGFVAAAAMTFVLATPAAVSAQEPVPTPEPQTQQQAQEPESSTLEGELVSVDAEAKEITVKRESGEEVVIAYSDATEISGAQNDAAGLATMTDARVTVHFTEDEQTRAKTATRIVVQPRG